MWTIYNDSKSCSLATSYKIALKLTGCSDEEFTCSDGLGMTMINTIINKIVMIFLILIILIIIVRSCVHMTSRCNGKNDCSDETDEEDCEAFVFAIGYDRFSVPPPLGNDSRHNVFFDLSIWDIVEINEKEGFFKSKILFTRKWIDQRVTFCNIQNEAALNAINPEEQKLLWTPWTVFNNIEDREKYTLADSEPAWRVIPNPNNSFVIADKDFLHNTYLFDGASNMISYEKGFTIEWLCDFQMEWFPFDTQSCTMEFVPNEDSVRLVPESVEYLGHPLPRHFIRNITMCRAMINGEEGIVVEIMFGRPILSKFLTVKRCPCY